jgi:predicted porin
LDGKPVATSWEFADGEIRLTRPSGGSASLLSQPLPNDFDLSWQYKIAERTNSGIKYRVRRFGNQWLGIEYQIIDEPLTPEAAGRKGSTAS